MENFVNVKSFIFHITEKAKQKEFICLSALFLFGLAIRVFYHLSAVMVEPAIRADALRYIMTAYNLLYNGTYSYAMREPVESSTLLVPGYPYFLALLQVLTSNLPATVKLAHYLQILMGSTLPIIIYLIARRFFSFPLAMVPAVLFCIYPHQIVGSSYLLTETVFTFWLTVSLWLFLKATETGKKLPLAACGILMGFATLTRPITLLLLPFLLIVLWRSESGIKKRLAIASAIVFVFWLPWSLWGNFMAEQQESNMRAVVALGSYPDFTYEEIRGFPNREDPNFASSTQSWNDYFEYFSERVRQQPAKYLGWYLIGKPISLWGFNIIQGQGGPFIYPVESSIYDLTGFYSWSYSILEFIHPVFILLALFICIWISVCNLIGKGKQFPLALTVCAGTVLYVTLFHVPLASLPRFSIPFQGLMLILVVYAFQNLINKYRHRV